MRAVHFEKIEGLGYGRQKHEKIINDHLNIVTQEYPDDMKKEMRREDRECNVVYQVMQNGQK